MTTIKKEFSAVDAAPLVIYAKTDQDSILSYPVTQTNGALDVNIKSGSSSGHEYNTGDTFVSGSPGTLSLVVRKDTGASLVADDGDYTALQVDSAGALRVTGGGGGTQYNDGDPRGSATGTLIMGDDGANVQSLSCNTAGNLIVELSPTGTMTITGSVVVLNSVNITGNTAIIGNVTITGQTTVINTVSTLVSNVVTITGTTSIIQPVTVTGNTAIIGTVTITGNTSIIGNVTITGQTAIINTVSIITTDLDIRNLTAPTDTVAISDGNGELELVKQADNYNAANHGIIVYGVDEGTPQKYRQMRMNAEGDVHVVLSEINDNEPDVGVGNASSGTLRVVLASNQPAVLVTGSTVIIGTVTITGSTSVVSCATHAVTQSGTWTITGSTAIVGTVTITGSTSIINTVSTQVIGNVTITGSTAVVNIVNITGSTSVVSCATHAVTQSGTWTITGSTAVVNTVSTTVVGSVTITGSTAIVGSVTITGSTTVVSCATHAVTQSGTWTFTGNTTVINTVSTTVVGTVTITGSTAIVGSVTVTGNTSVINTVTITGSTAIISLIPSTGSTNLGKAEDAAHTSGDVGVMMLGVRNDNIATFSTTNLDYTPISVNSAGCLHIAVRRLITTPTNINTTYNNTTTAATSAAIDVSAFRRGLFSFSLSTVSAPTDFLIELQMSDVSGGTYYTYKKDFWADYRFDDTAVGTTINEVMPFETTMSFLRVYCIASGTDASKTFTMANARIEVVD